MSRFGFNFGRNTNKRNNRVGRDDVMLRRPPAPEYDDYESEYAQEGEDNAYYDTRDPRDAYGPNPNDPRLNMNPYRTSDARAGRDMRRQSPPERPLFEDDAMLGFRRTNADQNDDDYGNDEYAGSGSYSGQRQSGAYQQRQAPSSNRHAQHDELTRLGFWHNDESDMNYDDSEADMDRPSPLKFIIAITGLVFICTVTWLAYRWISLPTSDTPPLIQAETTPYRVRPDNPGGTDFPHQDKLIYGRLAPTTDQPVERLLPAQEQTVIMAPTYNNPQGQQQQVQPQGQQQQVAPQQQPYQQPSQQQPGQQQQGYYPQQPTGQQQGQAIPNQAPAPEPTQANQQQPQLLVPGQVYSAQQYPLPQQGQATNQMQPNQAQIATQNGSPNTVEPDLNGLPQNKMAQNPATLMEHPDPAANPAASSAATLDAVVNATDVKASPTDTSLYYLQLGTLISADLAKKEKDRLQKRYATELKGMDLSVKSFVGNDGSKKYRIVTGPTIQSRKAAQDKCATLGNACMPIRN